MKENKPFPWREGMIKPLTLEETVCLIFFLKTFFSKLYIYLKKKKKKKYSKEFQRQSEIEKELKEKVSKRKQSENSQKKEVIQFEFF